MKKTRNIITVTIPVIVLALEYLLFAILPQSWLSLAVFILFVVETVIIFWLQRNRKDNSWSQSLLLSVQGAFSIPSIVLFIFLFTQITWFQNCLQRFIFGECDQSIMLMNSILLIEVAILPFLLQSLFLPVPKLASVKPGDRKILITSISLIDPNRVANETLTNKEIEFINKFKNHSAEKLLKIPDRDLKWQPILYAIMELPCLGEVYILGSEQSKFMNNRIREHKDGKSCDVQGMINKVFPDRNIKVIEVQITDMNAIEETCHEIQNKILGKHDDRYDDKEIVFGITGGTATVACAMSLLAVKGQRGIIYTRQDTSETVQYTVDVLTIKQLWDEILEKILRN